MRNVSIWANEAELHELTAPVCLRLFEYKGNKRTLNEFLYPNYIHRGSQLAPRDLNQPGECTLFDLDIKGQVVLMGYVGITAAEEGNGKPFKVFPNKEQAVHWLVKNFFQFYGDESATQRRRKAVVVDLDAENLKFHAMAREYEKSLVKPVVAVVPVCEIGVNQAIKPVFPDVQVIPECYTKPHGEPTPPASRVVVDDDSLAKANRKKKPSFMDNMMKFLRLFRK